MLNRRGDNRDKNKDKPPPDPHREFLDAESTDEEERRKIYEKNIKPSFSPSFPSILYDSSALSSYFSSLDTVRLLT